MKLYTFKEVQDILRIGRTSLLKLLKSGNLKAKKVGGVWRVKDEDLNKYLEE